MFTFMHLYFIIKDYHKIKERSKEKKCKIIYDDFKKRYETLLIPKYNYLK